MHSEKQKFPRDTRQKYHFISFPPACQIFTALRPPPEGKEGGAGVGRGGVVLSAQKMGAKRDLPIRRVLFMGCNSK